MQVEQKAFHIAKISVGSSDEALDILQDSMLKLVQKYAARPAEEWRPLFYRILNNRIMDFHRKRISRGRWMGWLKPIAGDDGDAIDADPIQSMPDTNGLQPAEQLASDLAGDSIIEAVKGLAARQQQAFLLRAWEGLSVKETAKAMKCSSGSVKTHYSRALGNLRKVLEENY